MTGEGKIIKLSSKGGRTKLVNNKLTLFKDFNIVLLVFKDKNKVQYLISQFNLDAQGNKKS